jgi:2-hydroxychromene-2-carboxylate isomerase
MPTIDYYFSVLSDWAYLGGERLEALSRKYGASINHMPMSLSRVYAGTGGILLQKRSKQRQAYRVVELERWRDQLGIPVTIHPRYYPTDDLLASCAIIAVKRSGGDTGRFANQVLRAIWVEDRNISDSDTLRRIADGVGLDGVSVLDSAREQSTLSEFNRYTDEAQERGVFGSPFYIVGDELFWGQDRLEFLESLLARSTGGCRDARLIAQTQGAAT